MIYYVEDDAAIRNLVIYTLNSMSMPARGFERGTEFWQAAAQTPPDLVLLDIMLPDESGLSILRRLRATPAYSGLPVILLTARDSEDDVVDGLDCGADGYIAKPFGIMELVARVKAMLRRSAPSVPDEVLCVGGIQLNTASHTVRADGRAVDLTPKEYELLAMLLRQPGHVCERTELLDAIWSKDYMGGDHTLDAHIQTLRSKLGSCGSLIQTVYGLGYKLSPVGGE